MINSRAGMIPYFVNHGIIEYMFMIPSDPNYGGFLPSIAKGHIDDHESALKAALRESNEELGLRQSNLIESSIILAWSGSIEGLNEKYNMLVFAGQVKNKHNFSKPHFETGKTVWMTINDFLANGRQSQKQIVDHVNQRVMQNFQ